MEQIMKDIKLNFIHAISYSWNIHQESGFFKRIIHTQCAAFQGLLGKYSVTVASAKNYINNPKYTNTSVFTFLKKSINKFSVTAHSPIVTQLNTHQEQNNGNVAINKIKSSKRK